MTNTLDTPLKTLSFPGLAKGQEQFVLMLRSWGKLSQLGSSWNTTGTGICQITYWNIIAVCRKWYYVYLPAVPLFPPPSSSPIHAVAKCEFDNFCNATDWGHLALEIAFKLFCQLRQCGGDAGSEIWLGDSWRLTGLASLARPVSYLRAICGLAAHGNWKEIIG